MSTLKRVHAAADDARSSKILLVMEYVEGGPVVSTSKAQHKHLSEAIARKYFRDALQVHLTHWAITTCAVSVMPPLNRQPEVQAPAAARAMTGHR